MPSINQIVINTSPLIAIVAAMGNLKILESLYIDVFVPFEVSEEILIGGATVFGVNEFQSASWLQKQTFLLNISPFLFNSLDLGEASVIQLALNKNISTVCIRPLA